MTTALVVVYSIIGVYLLKFNTKSKILKNIIPK